MWRVKTVTKFKNSFFSVLIYWNDNRIHLGIIKKLNFPIWFPPLLEEEILNIFSIRVFWCQQSCMILLLCFEKRPNLENTLNVRAHVCCVSVCMFLHKEALCLIQKQYQSGKHSTTMKMQAHVWDGVCVSLFLAALSLHTQWERYNDDKDVK